MTQFPFTPSPYGLHGRPPGDPGFTVAVEIATMLEDLSEDECAWLLAAVHAEDVCLEESALGNVRVVFDLPDAGWWDSGQAALGAVRSVEDRWAVAGVETCRSDVWAIERWFQHEPDGTNLVHLVPDEENTVTVAIELDAMSPRCPTSIADDVHEYFRYSGPVRLPQAPPGRHHIIVEQPGPGVDFAAALTAKSLHMLSGNWQISRLRVVVSDVYRQEVGTLPSSPIESVPEWQLAAGNDGSRIVVVPDIAIDLHGWSIGYTTHDGDAGMSDIVMDVVWSDEDGITNLRDLGVKVAAWTADIPGAAILERFIGPRGTTMNVDRWEGCTNWLVECLVGNPVGLVIDLGPSDYDPDDYDPDDYDPDDEETEVINAQLHILEDDVVMVRRSRTVLEQLRLTDHSSDGLTLDLWHHDEHFDDCTDGYLFSTDLRLVATACTVWFRDHGKFDALETLGCSYSFADSLPGRD